MNVSVQTVNVDANTALLHFFVVDIVGTGGPYVVEMILYDNGIIIPHEQHTKFNKAWVSAYK